jgi:catechol 2,3-dioxygenase-like lactoylglutathione lyase family enzyme
VEVLASRVLVRARDYQRSVAFYRDGLGLAVVREFGAGGRVTGTVFALGGGALEVSAGPPSAAGQPAAAGPSVQLWLQVRDAAAAHAELAGRGVPVLQPPRREPWGLVEMWVVDPDGVRIAVVEVPEDHPLRRRVD